MTLGFAHFLVEKVLSGGEISFEEALSLMNLQGAQTYDLLAAANRIRECYKGNRISLCAIINAKSGKCSEDCAFCAQSAHHKAKIEAYPLLGPEIIVGAAERAWRNGARRFAIVTSGKSLSHRELAKVCIAIERISRQDKIRPCASLGLLHQEAALRLKQVGLKRYHHNLETAASFFPNICTTHHYDEDLTTIKIAKRLGFEVCCGGIFGMGESIEQRVELAFTLKELGVDSVPINFLNPIPGTKLQGRHLLSPLECLRILATYRFILPSCDILTCGGREVNLRSLQPLMFTSGASGTMVGDYLVTQGRPPQEDLELIEDLELEVDRGESN